MVERKSGRGSYQFFTSVPMSGSPRAIRHPTVYLIVPIKFQIVKGSKAEIKNDCLLTVPGGQPVPGDNVFSHSGDKIIVGYV